MRRRSRRRLAILSLILILGFSAAPAAAQRKKDQGKRWYDVPALPQKKHWAPWIVAFLFAAGCVLIAFKNPHRTHLD